VLAGDVRWRMRQLVVACVVAGAGRAVSAAAEALLSLAAAADGGLDLRAGAATRAHIPLATPALRRGPARVREVSVEGHHLAEVSVPVRGAGNEEVWLGELRARDARVVWSGLLGAR